MDPINGFVICIRCLCTNNYNTYFTTGGESICLKTLNTT